MRALVVSDLHFGAWTGDPVLARPFALERLEPHLDDLDELVLLGDVFDFLFSSVEHAFEQAESFFELVRRKMQGKRVVFLAGNHDHHIVVRTLRSAVETKVASGAAGEELERVFAAEYRNFFQRFLDRRLAGVESEIVYPTYTVGDVLLTHGHYLDAHLTGSVPNRILSRASWTIAGGRPNGGIAQEDYEAVIVPLTELLFTVAQMPRGCAVQMGFHRQFERIGKILRLGTVAEHVARRAVRKPNGGSWRHRPVQLARACDPAEPAPVALAAFGRVVTELGWNRDAEKIVFAHTHQPLDGAVTDACGGVRFWNTGSWIHAPSVGTRGTYVNYLRRAWPGTAVLVDTERPKPFLIEMLADQNPLHGGGPRAGEMLRGEKHVFRVHGNRFRRRLRAHT
jgi:UDP-2,3-diacylglucosamine pyrophosphatase LpxH